MNNYCSVEDVKAVNNIGIDDALITDEMISVASEIVETFTGQIFYKDHFSLDVKNPGTYLYYLNYKLISIESSSIELTYKIGKSELSRPGGGRFGNFSVSGYWGYEEIPVTIKRATALLVIWLLKQEVDGEFQDGSLMREKMGHHEKEYFGNAGFPHEISILLRRYVDVCMEIL